MTSPHVPRFPASPFFDEFVSPLRPNTVDDGFDKPFRSNDLTTDLLSSYVKNLTIFVGVICFYNKNAESIEKKDVVFLVLFKFIVNTFARYLYKKV